MMINSVACNNCLVFYVNFGGSVDHCANCSCVDDIVVFPTVFYFVPQTHFRLIQPQGGVIASSNTFVNCGTAYHISGGALTSTSDKFIGCDQVVKSENKAKVKLVSPHIED
jgi:hypothetical protein